MDYCRITLLGRLTADPDIRYTPAGTPVTSFSMAVNRKYRRGDSEEVQDAVTFVPVRVYGKTAEHAGQYLGKGRTVLVDGELRSSEWQDQEGKDHRLMYVAAQKVIFLGKGNGNGQPAAEQEPAEATDADIPF